MEPEPHHAEPHHADPSLGGKLRRRFVRLQHRRPCAPRLGAPMISFSFDDAPTSAFTAGARILERFEARGTYFVSAGEAGRSGFVGPLGGRDDIVRAHRAGHEIACHTYSHMDCGQVDARTAAAEVARNAEALQSWGVASPETFAYPYGDVGARAKWVVAQRFRLSRGVHRDVIEAGTDLAQAPAVGIQGSEGEAEAMHWMDRALRGKAWLILFTHGVEDEVTRYGCTAAAFERLVERAVSQGFEIVTVAEGAQRMRRAQ